MLDKESIYLRQKLDCNCNDCKFMERDLITYQKWHDWHKDNEQKDFEKRQLKAIEDAKAIEDPKGRESMLIIAYRMKFQFDKSTLLNYGNCKKFNKQVFFTSETCQLETQECFIHRKD